jgi:hypothetical protein
MVVIRGNGRSGCRGGVAGKLACDAFEEMAEGARGRFTVGVVVMVMVMVITWPGHDR